MCRLPQLAAAGTLAGCEEKVPPCHEFPDVFGQYKTPPSTHGGVLSLLIDGCGGAIEVHESAEHVGVRSKGESFTTHRTGADFARDHNGHQC